MHSPPLRITQRTAAGITILDVHGGLIFKGGDEPLLRKEVAARVAQGDRKLLLDLSDVTIIDSGGVGSLVTAFLHTARRGGRLKLLCPNERVCKVLTMTQLNSVLDIFKTETDALDSFKNSSEPSDVVPS
jgi:anti-sigma B factor antagonist